MPHIKTIQKYEPNSTFRKVACDWFFTLTRWSWWSANDIVVDLILINIRILNHLLVNYLD